jgi:hypothetical protein
MDVVLRCGPQEWLHLGQGEPRARWLLSSSEEKVFLPHPHENPIKYVEQLLWTSERHEMTDITQSDNGRPEVKS